VTPLAPPISFQSNSKHFIPARFICGSRLRAIMLAPGAGHNTVVIVNMVSGKIEPERSIPPALHYSKQAA
jgi:hypothetical protein